MVDIQSMLVRLRVRMVLGKDRTGYRLVRRFGLGFAGGRVVPDILVLAVPVLALAGRGQVPRGSLRVSMFVFAVELRNQ